MRDSGACGAATGAAGAIVFSALTGFCYGRFVGFGGAGGARALCGAGAGLATLAVGCLIFAGYGAARAVSLRVCG